MINLIPPQGQKTLKREYLLRVGAVYAFLLSAVFVSVTVLLLPTYVLVSTQLNTSQNESLKANSFENQFQIAEAEIKKANDIIVQLRGGPTDTMGISKFIETIRKIAPKEITFNTFQTKQDKTAPMSFQVQGIASSRNALAEFKSALEHLPEIASAEIPIADLARDQDLPFVISITLKE